MPACNSYGISGAFAAICAGISWYLFQEKDCKVSVLNLFSSSDRFNPDTLQMLHYIAIIVGIVLFVLSFFDFAGMLYEISLLFIAACVGIFAAGCMMFYATYMAFWMSCKSAFGSAFDTANLTGRKNVIEAGDQIGMVIMVLDLLCACMLIGAAISFSRTY